MRCADRGGRCAVVVRDAMRCAVVVRDAMRGLVAFARCAALRVRCICAIKTQSLRRCHAFESSRLLALACNGGILRVGFFGISSTLIDVHTLPGQLADGWV